MDTSINVFTCDANRLLNSKQAAEYLDYKVSYIYNLVHKGDLVPYKGRNRSRGKLRFVKADLDKFLGRPSNGN
jgi:excisionase family DNA binding protein